MADRPRAHVEWDPQMFGVRVAVGTANGYRVWPAEFSRIVHTEPGQEVPAPEGMTQDRKSVV